MEALGKELIGLGEDGYLALLGHVDLAFNTDQVADIEVLPFLVLFLREIVDLCEDLDLAPSVVKVTERYLAHAALTHQTSCYSDCLACERIVVAGDLCRVVCNVVCKLFIRILACFLEGLKLLHTESGLFLDLFCT